LDVILGIGINVKEKSFPEDSQFEFPATSLEEVYGKEIDRLDLFVNIMKALLKWYQRLAEPSLINAWNAHLAYRDKRVSLVSSQGLVAEGRVSEVDEDGSLILDMGRGEQRHFHAGEIQMRLVDRS
jgi:biotin-(acetyl-CoA carboxylase) ligase